MLYNTYNNNIQCNTCKEMIYDAYCNVAFIWYIWPKSAAEKGKQD